MKAYKLDDLAPASRGAEGGPRLRPRAASCSRAAKCFACHRFDNEGGSNGPDLTGVAGRFSPRDLLESIIDPSKEISDQYAAVEIRTTDERVVIGRIVNLNDDSVHGEHEHARPRLDRSNVNRKNIESMKPSKVSMMPAGLLDTFKEDEVLDLMAYLLSRGDRNSADVQEVTPAVACGLRGEPAKPQAAHTTLGMTFVEQSVSVIAHEVMSGPDRSLRRVTMTPIATGSRVPRGQFGFG